MKRICFCILLFLMAPFSEAEHAVLFVSLGMPDNALAAYFKQGKQYHIPVVIRGLYTQKQNQSTNPYVGRFKDTANRVKKLLNKSKVGGVSIDPILFRAFHIKVVPALVVYNDHLSCINQTNHAPYTPCSTGRFDVIFGNLPIKKLLSVISNQSHSGARSDFSQSLLAKYKKAGEGA